MADIPVTLGAVTGNPFMAYHQAVSFENSFSNLLKVAL